MTTTMTKPTQINFVVVELFYKEGNINTKPELGLFRGLRLRTSKNLETGTKSQLGLLNLILLGQTGQNTSLNGFSHDYYKVMSIRLGYGTTKEYMIFKSSDEDQKLALEILGAILDTLREEKKMLENDSEIIDLDKYKDLPYDLNKDTATTSTTTVGAAGYNTRNVSTVTTDWEKKRKEEEAEKARQEALRYTPYMVKRTSELPNSEVLKAMKAKIVQIAAKTYTPAELPVVKNIETANAAAPPPPPPISQYMGE